MGEKFGTLNSYDRKNTKIRPPIVDGIFYPDKKDKLAEEIDLLFKETLKETRGKKKNDIFALVTPHAALEYSGRLTAVAYNTLSERMIETVIILASMHRDPIRGFALPTASFFELPGFRIPVNREYIEKILSISKYAIYDDISHFEEHSIEVQLPFIHHVLPKVDIVPILMGMAEEKLIMELSRVIFSLVKENFSSMLIVVSSNMSSYLTGKDWKGEEAEMLRLIGEQDWKGMINGIRQGKVTACGAGCIASLYAMQSLPGGVKMETSILDRTNSYLVNHDEKKVISYAAVAITGAIGSE